MDIILNIIDVIPNTIDSVVYNFNTKKYTFFVKKNKIDLFFKFIMHSTLIHMEQLLDCTKRPLCTDPEALSQKKDCQHGRIEPGTKTASIIFAESSCPCTHPTELSYSKHYLFAMLSTNLSL